MSLQSEAYKKWRQRFDYVQRITAANPPESPSQKAANIRRALADYDYFCNRYFSHYMTDAKTGKVCKNAPFHLEAANKIRHNPNLKAVFMWPRGHAKSTHMNIFIPMWLMFQTPRQMNVMIIVGKSEDAAIKQLSDLQGELQYNQRIKDDFGQQYNSGSWEEGEFVTTSGVACFSLGRGQSPRGLRYHQHRPDYIVIDDLDDDELVKNPARVLNLTDWVKEALFGCLNVGRGRFIMVGNLFSKNSVLANMAANEEVFLSRVNGLDKDGHVVWSDKWTDEEAAAYARFVGYRAFQGEIMHNPISVGTVFKNEWIKWKPMLPLDKYERIIAYCDPSFKGTTKNDYKAIKVWARPKEGVKGASHSELHHLFAFVRQCSVSEMVRWFYDLHERMPENVICDYYMEANFMQDVILDEFSAEGAARGYQLPIRPDKRKKPDKFQRIEAISPLWERGYVFYNEALKNDPDMTVGLEQTLAFEKGTRSHDDAPDADEGAIYLLQKLHRVESFTPVLGNRPSAKNTW